ncbi:MAG: oligosaccharide flippase family protein [Gammaproteobacteria bacterium]|nr:oligosaccharide flippase family protein [Gammaproteobacteria bacterium]
MSRNIVRGSVPIFFWRVSGAGLAFVTQIMLARWMGAAALGEYVLAFSWLLLLSIVAGAGLPNAAIRFVGIGRARGDQAYIQRFANTGAIAVLVTSVCVAAVGALLISATSGLVPEALVAPLLIAMLALPFFAITSFYLGVANAHSWFSLSFIPNNFVRPLLFLIAVTVVWYWTSELTATRAMFLHLLALALVTVVSVSLIRVRLANLERGPMPRGELRLWLRTGVPLLVVTLVSNYFAELNVILLGGFLPSSDIAIFNASYRVALLVAFGLFAVDAFIAPELATLAAGDDKAKLQKIVMQATRLRTLGALVALVFFALAGRQMLRLFGAEFVVGYPALMLLTLAQLVHAAAGPGTRLLSTSGHQDVCLPVFGVALALLAALTILLVPRYGLTGAAMATFCAVACWSIGLAVMVVRYMHIQPSILSLLKR